MRNDLVHIQCQRNSDSSALHDSFTQHRDNVMRLILASATDVGGTAADPCQSIALMGAGNGMDVEMDSIAQLFREIHLIDVDDAALQRAVQHSSAQDRIHLHAPVDVASPLLSLTSRDFQVSDGDLKQNAKILQLLAEPNMDCPVAQCDVVVSLCMLTQIIETLAQIIPETHASFEFAVKALRMGHLRRMQKLLRQGGVGVIVTDIVSSDSAPELRSTTLKDLPGLLKSLVENRNFFTGANPSAVLTDLNILSRLPGGANLSQAFDPWLWSPGERVFAVYAIRFQAAPRTESLSP